MKHMTYSFTDSDIATCLFALSQLHLLHDDEISEVQTKINEQCATSAISKLSSREQLSPNELRVLCCCITCCNLVCQGAIPTDNDTHEKCMQYVFSLNKLDNELCSQIY